MCRLILEPVILIIKTFIQVARDIVRTVCEWVTRTIRTVREVVEKICKSLPWPLSLLCKFVTKVIEVIENITEWVCHEVIDRIFEWVQVVMEYIYYIARWICWIITWITIRWIEYLLCRAGIEISKNIRVCVKVLSENITDKKTGAIIIQPAVTNTELNAMLSQASAVFRQCNINIIVDSIDIIGHPEFLRTTTCDFGNTFSSFWVTFSREACSSKKLFPVITIYVVEKMTNAGGCAFPGTDWIITNNPANSRGGLPLSAGNTIVQEIGHLCDLFAHSSDPNNVMTDQPGGTSDQLDEHQCCIIRSSRFVTFG
jgi:hypothetical protein